MSTCNEFGSFSFLEEVLHWGFFTVCEINFFLLTWCTCKFSAHFMNCMDFNLTTKESNSQESLRANFTVENSNAEKFHCSNGCGRSYVFKASLYRHLKYECGKSKQFTCEICGKKFTHRSDLRKHTGIVHEKIMD